MKIDRPFAWLSSCGGAWLADHGVALAWALTVIGALWIVLDLARPVRHGRPRGLLTALVAAALLLCWTRLGLPVKQPAYLLLAGLAGGIQLYALARYEWPACSRARTTRTMHGVVGVLLVLLTLFKCLHLAGWPAVLHDYAAMTGADVIQLAEKGVTAKLWQGKANDLQSGGQTPLHGLLLLGLYTLFHPGVFAVRLAEVLGSTLALVFFWLWLARAFSGWWGVAAWLVFALSPGQLAQSRMGTYQSLSLALALALLWLGDGLLQRRGRDATWYRWLAFGLVAGLIGYAYAPIRPLYAWCLLVLLVGLVQTLPSRTRWLGPVVAFGVLAGMLGYQLHSAGGAERMFRTQMGMLATDTAIWHKTATEGPGARVSHELQPLPVVVNNLAQNVQVFLSRLFDDWRYHVMYAPAVVFGVLFALVALVRRWAWAVPLYFLAGMVSLAVIFPVMRRMYVAVPLVFVGLTLYFRVVCDCAEQLLPWRAWRVSCRCVIVLVLVLAGLHGLHLFARENGHLGFGPAFGTPWRAHLIAELQTLLPEYQLIILNPQQTRDAYQVKLYQRAKETGGSYRCQPLRQNHPVRHLVDPNVRTCFAYQEEAHRTWIGEYLQQQFPQGRLVKRRLPPPSNQVGYVLFLLEPASE